MSEMELPLVLFTVLTQWAVGIVLIIALLEWVKPSYLKTDGVKHLRTIAITAFPICAVGTLASIFHLGQPFQSYKSLLALEGSWLSREILAFIIVNILLLVFSWIWWKHPGKEQMRKWVGTVSAVVGVIGVLVSAQCYYQMSAHPTWHNWTTFASFVLTALILGLMTILYSLAKAQWGTDGNNPGRLLAGLLAATIILMVVVLYTSGQGFFGGAEANAAVGTAFSSALFWTRIMLSLILPAVFILYLYLVRKPVKASLIFVAAVCVLAGELAGRIIFYYSVMSQQPWF